MTTPFQRLIPTPDSQKITLEKEGNWPAAVHRFTAETLWALDMALLTGRPLLIRGKPGIGKSQIARAAANVMQVPFLPHVIDERSERDDLLYQYDAVARLAEAQICSLFAGPTDSPEALSEIRGRLAEENVIRPGMLWWALNWDDAERQGNKYSQHCRSCPAPANRGEVPNDAPCSAVVLIDEIDKADPALPNGLLECLGTEGFRSVKLAQAVSVPKGGKRPLIIFTTNEERDLPPAFLRRCLVLTLRMPKEPEAAKRFLIEERARVVFSAARISDSVCGQVADLVLSHRLKKVPGGGERGAAEFLDLVTALVKFAEAEVQSDDPDDREVRAKREEVQKQWLQKLAEFVLRKTTEE